MTDFLIPDEKITQILATSGKTTAPPYSWLKIGNSEISSKKVVFLLFDTQGISPVCVVKIGRSQAEIDRMENEFSYQTFLWNTTPDRPNIAQPIAFLASKVGPIIIEQWLPGTTLLREFYLGKHTGLDAIKQDIRETFSQIYFPFINATIDRSCTIDRKIEVLKLLKRVSIECPELLIAQEFEYQILKELNTFSSWSCPSTGRHGDFWLGNIIVNKGKYHLIDWDTYRKVSDPCFDFYHFWVTFSLIYPGESASAKEKFVQCFLKNRWFSDLFQNTSNDIYSYFHISPNSSMVSMTSYLFENLLNKKDQVVRNGEEYQTWLEITQSFINCFSEFSEIYSNLRSGSGSV